MSAENGDFWAVHNTPNSEIVIFIQNSSGAVQEIKLPISNFKEYPTKIIQTQDGGFLIACTAQRRLDSSFPRNFGLVIKLSETGEELWR